jgi:Leucine-rich repeat (LRR) protein
VDFRPVAAEVNDSQLESLEGLHSLVELYLSGSSISDASLDPLARHQQLETLDLQQTQVGNQVFQLVDQLPALKTLVLSGTAVTLEEIRQQRSRLLQVRIVHLA